MAWCKSGTGGCSVRPIGDTDLACFRLVYPSFKSLRAALQNVVFAWSPEPWPILSDFCWENGQWADSSSYAPPSFAHRLADLNDSICQRLNFVSCREIISSLPMDPKHAKNFMYMMISGILIENTSCIRLIFLTRRNPVLFVAITSFAWNESDVRRKKRLFNVFRIEHIIFMQWNWCFEEAEIIQCISCRSHHSRVMNLMFPTTKNHSMVFASNTSFSCSAFDVCRTHRELQCISCQTHHSHRMNLMFVESRENSMCFVSITWSSWNEFDVT